MAGNNYLLGVDIGTSGSKGVLVDLGGNVIAHQSVEHGVDTPRPGWFEHDADAIWWADFKRICRALIAETGAPAGEIAAVGVSALCPDMLPVDENGRPLRKGILYCDSRAQVQHEQIIDRFGDERILEMTGHRLSTSSIGPKMLWFRDNEPALFDRTRKVYSATSYIIFKLTGESVVDYMHAPFYDPMFDIRRMDWDLGVCEELGLSPELLPALRWATDVAGGVTRDSAAETGLAEGTPVITGTCDGTAEGLSVGAVREGEASLLYGTTMGLAVMSDSVRTHPALVVLPGAIPNTYRTAFAMSASGALTTWFRDNFGQVEQEVEAQLGINAYALLSAQGSDVPPGSEGLIVLPYFAGERSPIYDPLARGLILGLTLSHTRKHVYRALLEGVAYSLRHSLEMLVGTGVKVKRIIATGGGTRNRLWTQIVSDVIGKDQEIAVQPFGSPYGDAFMAGYGVGIFKDVSPLRTGWASETSRVEHNPETKRVYDKYYAVYRELYETNKDHMHALAQLSL